MNPLMSNCCELIHLLFYLYSLIFTRISDVYKCGIILKLQHVYIDILLSFLIPIGYFSKFLCINWPIK